MAEPAAATTSIAGLSQALNRSGRLRGYATMCLSVGGLLITWRITFNVRGAGVEAVPFQSIFLNLFAVFWIARLLARTPRRRAKGATDYSPVARQWSGRYPINPPKVIVKASRRPPGAAVRGWKRDTAVVISVDTAALWAKYPRKQAVQLTHELAHIQAGDHHLYYRSRSFSAMSVAFLLLIAYLFHFNGDGNGVVAYFTARVLLLALLTLITARAYLRFREHAADVAAAAVLDDAAAVAAELPGTAERTLWNRLLGLHPSPARRRAVVSDPTTLLAADRWSYALLGIGGGLLTAGIQYFLLPLILAGGGTPDRVIVEAAIVTGVVVAIVATPALIENFRAMLSLRAICERAALLYAGLTAGLLFLSPAQQIPGSALDPLRWLRLALVVAGGLIVLLGAGLFPRKVATAALWGAVFAGAAGVLVSVAWIY